jgi:hypothetical protein
LIAQDEFCVKALAAAGVSTAVDFDPPPGPV